MIVDIEHKENNESQIEVTFKARPLKEGSFKWSKGKVTELLTNSGIKVGALISGQEVSNKPSYPQSYKFVYEKPAPKKVSKKVEKAVDTVEKPVRIRKSRTKKVVDSGE